jgi:hypothetical protein
MNKEFIPYEQALDLKELMISVECMAYYNDGILKIHQDGFRNCKNIDFIAVFNDEKLCAAPLYQQAFRWFREKYVLLGFIEPANGYEDKSLFAFYICDDEQNIVDDSHSYSKDSSLHFKTYEESELACLKKLIEIVKNK